MNADLSALGAAPDILVVDEHVHVVFAGGDDQRASAHAGPEKRRQHGRGAKAFLHADLVLAVAERQLVHAGLEGLQIDARRSHIALGLAVHRQLQRTVVGHDMGFGAQAGHQNHVQVADHDRAGDGGRLGIGDLKGKRRFPALARDLHRVRAGGHAIDDELALLQFRRRLIVEGHLALIEIGENAEALRLRLQRKINRDRLAGIHFDAARRGLIAVEESGDLIISGRETQAAIGGALGIAVHAHRGSRRIGRDLDLHGGD